MAVTIINRDNFEEKVLKADKPVILDLWASWCGPCKMLAPVVEELSEAHPEVLVGKVNVDEEPELGGSLRSDGNSDACAREKWRGRKDGCRLPVETAAGGSITWLKACFISQFTGSNGRAGRRVVIWG